ncbi:MAG: prolyl oligopeptidase family serine peptidase [Bacteroidales bacterium]|nr:prolyl oligopeptidase family serine peptidase [Bacteroidales bacterium]
MPYRIAHISGTGKPSLVIYLHGGSSKGNDNETQMSEAGIDSIANYLESKQIEAIFLVPQCPSDKSWGGPMLGILKSLTDKYIADGTVDDNSLFIFGGSMGGTGTWSMLSAYPRLFTAAMPVAGNPSKCDPDKVALTPVYTVMGTSDQIMSVETTSNFIGELNTRNGITQFDIEDGWTHEMTCIQSYTTHRLDWVFSHNNNLFNENPTSDKKIVKSTQYYSIDGKALSGPPHRGLYIVRCVNEDGSVNTLKSFN